MSVVVIGAGIVGLTCAERLVRSGHTVTVVDALGPTRDGASFGNAGIIVPSHFVPLAAPGVVRQGLRWLLDRRSPFYVQPRLDRDLMSWGLAFMRSANAGHVARAAPVLAALNLQSRGLYDTLIERVGVRTTLTAAGLLILCRSEQGLHEEREVAERAEALGLQVEALDASEVAQRIGTSVDVVGGCHYLDDAHVSPGSLMADLQDHLTRNGATFAWGWGGARIERSGNGVRVRDDKARTLAADTIVVAGGGGTNAALAPLGVRLPLQGGRGYSFMVPVGEALTPRVPAILAEARVAVSPLSPGGMRVGGTLEIVPPSAKPSPARVDGIATSAAAYFPDLSATIAKARATADVWSGFRPCSPDGVPYVGRLPRHPEVIVAAGHAMMGVSLAPVTAEIVAALVDGEQAPVSPDALRLLAPERFLRST